MNNFEQFNNSVNKYYNWLTERGVSVFPDYKRLILGIPFIVAVGQPEPVIRKAMGNYQDSTETLVQGLQLTCSYNKALKEMDSKLKALANEFKKDFHMVYEKLTMEANKGNWF